jgi:hypothetical protein
MRKLILLILPIVLFVSCDHSSQIKAQRLKDTLEILKRASNFRPLNSVDAYNFINQYYLPRLDTMPTKRKIFIYPLNGIDFKARFKYDEAKLKKQYSGNPVDITSEEISYPPLSIFFSKNFSWDEKKLLKTKIIADDTIISSNSYPSLVEKTEAWHLKYGKGYIWLSYPQYNVYTKRLVIKEWIEDGDFICGTGRLKEFWFSKVKGGWKSY